MRTLILHQYQIVIQLLGISPNILQEEQIDWDFLEITLKEAHDKWLKSSHTTDTPVWHKHSGRIEKISKLLFNV